MEDLKEKVDEVMKNDNALRDEIYKHIKENIGNYVAEYFKDHSINGYYMEDAIRTSVKHEINTAVGNITEDIDFCAEIKSSIKKNTEKYVSELVRGEVYNILKTGELREVVKETIKSILPMIIYNNLANHVDAEISNNFYNQKNNAIKEITDIISDKIRI